MERYIAKSKKAAKSLGGALSMIGSAKVHFTPTDLLKSFCHSALPLKWEDERWQAIGYHI